MRKKGKRARQNEKDIIEKPGSQKKNCNTFISKVNPKIKHSSSMIIVGEPGHRYYSLESERGRE